MIAARVAASLGAANTWWQKEQRHTREAFERAIYLSSGEADCAIHYPEDHLLHARLAGQVGFVSLFRGDECFGWSKYKLLTNRGALATSLIARLSMDAGYDGIVDPELLEQMAREQADLLDASIADLRSTTPTGRCDEIYYHYRFRRVLAPYNTVKHADLEVYTPFIDRHLLEWIKRVPDHARVGKKLFHEALVRRFPDLAAIPFAARSNLPDWERRWSSDPGVAGFFHSWCAEPGWLDTLGTKREILAVLRDMETGAAALQSVGPEPSEEGRRATLRRAAKRTYPGLLLREMTLERRYARNIPPYLRFARLAVLHGLLGRIQQRRSSNRVLDATIARSTVDP